MFQSFTLKFLFYFITFFASFKCGNYTLVSAKSIYFIAFNNTSIQYIEMELELKSIYCDSFTNKRCGISDPGICD